MRKIISAVLGMALAVAVTSGAAAQPNARPSSSTMPAPASPIKETTSVDPASLALAHQILAIGIPAEKRPEMFSSVMDLLKAQARESTKNLGLGDKDLQAVMDRSTQRMWDEINPIMNAAIPDIFESMAHAYARQFSTDDLKALLAFVKTPAGQRFFERAPMILKDPDVQAANQRMTAQLMTKLPGILRDNLRDIQDYAAKKEKDKKAATPAPVS